MPKVERFGTNAVGLRITGKIEDMEADHYRIVFPGGHVDVCRAVDGVKDPPYWVHVYVNKEDSNGYDPTEATARIVGARLDQTDKHAADSDLGDFEREQLYHLAVRVEKTGEAKG
jgi:hypothetical protein